MPAPPARWGEPDFVRAAVNLRLVTEGHWPDPGCEADGAPIGEGSRPPEPRDGRVHP